MVSSQGRPVFVFVGGRGRTNLIPVHDDCHAYDVSGELCDAITIPKMPEGRAWSAAVSNRDTIYVVGGYPTPMLGSKSLFKFSLSTMSWTQLSDMHIARIFHMACLVGDYIVVIGGIDDRNKFQRSTECYKIKEDTWFHAQDYPRVKNHDMGPTEGATCTWRGKCVVSGGWRMQVGCYDIQQDEWTRLADMVHGRRGHSMACVNDRLYVFGGSLNDNIEMYDPAVGQFTVISDLGIKLSHTNAVTYGTKVLIPAGNDENTLVTYDTETNKVNIKRIHLPATYSQAVVTLLYISFPSLKDICFLKILHLLKNHSRHGKDWCIADVAGVADVGKLALPEAIKHRLLELASDY